MPQQKASHHRRQQDLQRKATELRRQVAAEQFCHEQGELRQQVLTDLCQLTEALEYMQRTKELVRKQFSTAEPAHDGADTAGTQQHLAAALRAVPKFCCTAGLMYRATPELLQLILSLDAAAISQLFRSTFYEVVALLELTSRHQEPAVAAPAQQAGQSEGVALTDSKDSSSRTSAQATSSDNSHNSHTGSEGDRAGTPLPEASAQHPAACQTDAASAAAEEAALQDAVGRFVAVTALTHLLNPMPVIQAACVNHLTHQQGEAPPQHWARVTSRLQLTPEQAAYLHITIQEVRSVRLNAWSKLHSVLQSAASPNLLVLTAQQQQQQAVPSAVLRSAASATTSDSGAGAGEPAGPHFTESQPLQRLKRLAIYPALNGVLLVDTLTLKQKATLIVASYPWIPGPVAICSWIAETREQQQQQPSRRSAAKATAAAGDGALTAAAAAGSGGPVGLRSLLDAAVSQQHLHLRRQCWWQQQAELTGRQENGHVGAAGLPLSGVGTHDAASAGHGEGCCAERWRACRS